MSHRGRLLQMLRHHRSPEIDGDRGKKHKGSAFHSPDVKGPEDRISRRRHYRS